MGKLGLENGSGRISENWAGMGKLGFENGGGRNQENRGGSDDWDAATWAKTGN